jgi:hypothetical protein
LRLSKFGSLKQKLKEENHWKRPQLFAFCACNDSAYGCVQLIIPRALFELCVDAFTLRFIGHLQNINNLTNKDPTNLNTPTLAIVQLGKMR